MLSIQAGEEGGRGRWMLDALEVVWGVEMLILWCLILL
jgi:hypothetical protein